MLKHGAMPNLNLAPILSDATGATIKLKMMIVKEYLYRLIRRSRSIWRINNELYKR
jgi:hypothetical protein